MFIRFRQLWSCFFFALLAAGLIWYSIMWSKWIGLIDQFLSIALPLSRCMLSWLGSLLMKPRWHSGMSSCHCHFLSGSGTWVCRTIQVFYSLHNVPSSQVPSDKSSSTAVLNSLKPKAKEGFVSRLIRLVGSCWLVCSKRKVLVVGGW
jgi:hypothetical protein